MSADITPSSRDVQRLLDTLHSAFQPVVDIRAGRIVGYEALSRFTPSARHGPGDWFTAARKAGLGVDLETKACIAALRWLPRIPDDQFISVNLSPDALMSDEARESLVAGDPSRVILELTEQADAPDLLRQTEHIVQLRRQGVRLAIDDIGAGYSSIVRILHLSPDLLKVDRCLVQGCAADPLRRYVLEVMASLAEKQGGEVVAEGVEDPSDLLVVHEIGIRYAQGYLLGRPSSQPADLTDHHRRLLAAMSPPQRMIDLDDVPSIPQRTRSP